MNLPVVNFVMHFGSEKLAIEATPAAPGSIPDAGERVNPLAMLTGITPTSEAIAALPHQPDGEEGDEFDDDV